MGEKQFRNKIQWFTFLFSILVVWVHAFNAELFLGKGPVAAGLKRVETVVGNGLGQFAVPGFFMISAYLFYRGFTWEKLGRKWKSRFRSLVVPYLLWNGIYYLGYVTASRIGGLTDIVGKGRIPLDWKTALDAVVHYRYNAVFWYLYQLIWLIALTPLIYSFLKRKGTAALWLAASAVCVGLRVDFPFINEDSVLYYSAAAAAAIYMPKQAEGQSGPAVFLTGAGMAAAGLACCGFSRGGEQVGLLVFGRLLVPLGVWLMADKRLLPPVKPWMKDTFFLYATHFAFVRLVNKTGAVLLPGNRAAAAVLFIFMPAFSLVFSRGVGTALKRFLPPVWKALSGGRNS